MCHMTNYSTIRGVFQQPWPGVSQIAILNEEKALGTRMTWTGVTFLHSVDVVTLYDILYHVKMLVLKLRIHTACIL